MEPAQEGAPIAVTTILPGPIDTPFFEHSRSKLGVLPKSPSPVHAPEIVADSIVRSTTRCLTTAPTTSTHSGRSREGARQPPRPSAAAQRLHPAVRPLAAPRRNTDRRCLPDAPC